MRRRVWAIMALPSIALIALLVAISDTDGPSDFSTSTQPSGVGVVVGTGDGWTLEFYESSDGCYLLRIDGETTYCQSTHYPPGSSTWKVVQGRGHRIAVLLYGSEEPVTGRWFSSISRAEPLTGYQVRPGMAAFVVDLDDGENPWGIQVVDETGALVAATSFVS
ncbi:MAG: hypothetical protein ABMA25_06845 [Ilumatobacteraceae bacterium]